MREKWQKQMPLMSHITDHAQCQELETISRIIDANATICNYILQDLNKGKVEAQRAGAKGMSADQVLRCAIVKTLFGFSYEQLAFHIVDSQSLRWFCRIGMADCGSQFADHGGGPDRLDNLSTPLSSKSGFDRGNHSPHVVASTAVCRGDP